MKDFDDAIDRIVAGLEKKRVMNDKERRIVAYHEAGHAIVASSLPGLDPVHKISIVARGFGALGYTMQLPLEDRYLLTRQDLLNQLSVLLGGRSAEEIAFGEVTTGAQNDLMRATDIARAMVAEFGMSDTLGAVNYASQNRSAFLENPFASERGNYSEDTAVRIDAEVKRILGEAHDVARRELTAHRGVLDRLSERLLEVEVIEAEELQRIMRENGAESSTSGPASAGPGSAGPPRPTGRHSRFGV
jgi:cell division protease FtsH